MKYKSGDKVKIVSDTTGSISFNNNGLMDKWLGQTMTIHKIVGTGILARYKMVEDEGRWFWQDNMIESLVNSTAIKFVDLEEQKVYRELNQDVQHLYKIEDGDLWTRHLGYPSMEWFECDDSLLNILDYQFIEVDKGQNLPLIDSDYYFIEIGRSAGIYTKRWLEDNIDIERFKINNVFKTREEAEKKLKAIEKLLAYKEVDPIETMIEDMFNSIFKKF